MKQIILYRNDFKLLDADGNIGGFFDAILGQLGIPEGNREDYDEITFHRLTEANIELG